MPETDIEIPDNLSLMPVGQLLPPAEVINLAEVVARRAAKFQGVLGELQATISRRGEEAARSAANAGFPLPEQQAAAKNVSGKARADLIKSSDETRWGFLRELAAAERAVAVTSELYASPQTVLARAGLGTPERSHLLAQLQGSGPVQLRNMAQLAMATGNKVLGAALQHIVDGMPARERPFSSADLAERLVGEETRALQGAIRSIRIAAQQAINANREFMAGRARPMDRIKLAMEAR